jgi:hypothetical protein
MKPGARYDERFKADIVSLHTITLKGESYVAVSGSFFDHRPDRRFSGCLGRSRGFLRNCLDPFRGLPGSIRGLPARGGDAVWTTRLGDESPPHQGKERQIGAYLTI